MNGLILSFKRFSVNANMNNSLRQQYLTAIGIQSWQLNTTLEDDFVEPEIIQENHPHKTDNKLIKNSPGQADSEKHSSIAVKADIFANKNTHNEQIISSQKESYNNPLDDRIADKELIKTKIIDPAELQPDSELDNSIHLCKKCPSRSTRLNALAGQGYSNASVFFVSGAPDAEEDRQQGESHRRNRQELQPRIGRRRGWGTRSRKGYRKHGQQPEGRQLYHWSGRT